MQKVGFIGLGTMGTPMAWNVHRAGYELGVYNRGAQRTISFQQENIRVFHTPAGLAGWADVIIIRASNVEG